MTGSGGREAEGHPFGVADTPRQGPAGPRASAKAGAMRTAGARHARVIGIGTATFAPVPAGGP